MPLATLGTVFFSNANGVTFGMVGQTITASVAPGGGGITGINVSAGTTSQNLSALTFGNANGITFGLDAAASQITASHNALTSQSNQALSGSNGSFTFQTATFGNLNGLSFYTSNGSMVGSYTVPATAGLISHINVSAGTTSNNLSALTFDNAGGVTFGLAGSVITAAAPAGGGGITNVRFSAGTTSNLRSDITFGDANGISFGLNAGTITASHNALTSQSNQALSGSNGSFTFQTATFGNLNGLSFYTSNGSLVGSYTVPIQSNQTLGLYAVGNTTGQSSSSTFDARTLSFSGAGIASVGYSAGNIIISVPAGAPSPVNFSAGTTSNNLGSVVFSNSNGVSFGLNGSTITASVNAGGGAAVSRYEAVVQHLLFPRPPDLVTNITGITSRPLFIPWFQEGQLTINNIHYLLSRSTSGSNAFTVHFGLYTHVNSTQISLIGSFSNSYSATATASVSGLRKFVATGVHTGWSTLSAGDYIIGMMFAAGSTSAMNYSMVGVNALSHLGAVLPGANTYETATSGFMVPFWGRYTANSSVLPDSVAKSQVIGQFTGASSPLQPWLAFNNG